MLAHIRQTTLYFDIDGVGLLPDGAQMVEHRPAFAIHGGPGGEHSDLKLAFKPLTDQLQMVYFDHRGQGRSARGDKRLYNLDENVEDMEALRLHLGLGPIISMGTSYGGMVAMAHAHSETWSVRVFPSFVVILSRKKRLITVPEAAPTERAVNDILPPPSKSSLYKTSSELAAK